MLEMSITQVNTFTWGLSGSGNKKLCNDFLPHFTPKRGLIPDTYLLRIYEIIYITLFKISCQLKQPNSQKLKVKTTEIKLKI